MAAIQSIRVGCMLLREDEVALHMMYMDMFKSLNNICAKYGAVIDLTQRGKLFIMNTTNGCRKSIRKVYGKNVQMDRYNKVVQLRGFL